MTSSSETLSWRLTGAEREAVYTAASQAIASLFLGWAGPVAAWAVDYLFNRRNLIFDRCAAPHQAIGPAGQALGLPSLGLRSVTGQSTLSVVPEAGRTARQAGLRAGDPVSLIVAGRPGAAGSRLLVPARIGERVRLAVPPGTYSVAGFAGRRDTFFTAPDPYQAVTGTSVVLGDRQKVHLPLAARTPALPRRRQQSTPCSYCGAAMVPGLLHLCPRFRCAWCDAAFYTPTQLDAHIRRQNETCLGCGQLQGSCFCLVGRLKRAAQAWLDG